MADRCDDNCCRNNDSGFLFGMIIGAIIGAFVAIYFYKNKKSQVFNNFQEKLQAYFKNIIPKTQKSNRKSRKKNIIKKPVVIEKIPVILPHEIIKESTPLKSIATKSKKMFKK